MSLIPCNDDCIYQKEGYCELETPAEITNHTGGCMHYVSSKNSSKAQLISDKTISPSKPQMPL